MEYEIMTRLDGVHKEIKQLDRARSSYKIKSEWHRLMYSRLLEMEVLENLLPKTKTNSNEQRDDI